MREPARPADNREVKTMLGWEQIRADKPMHAYRDHHAVPVCNDESVRRSADDKSPRTLYVGPWPVPPSQMCRRCLEVAAQDAVKDAFAAYQTWQDNDGDWDTFLSFVDDEGGPREARSVTPRRKDGT